ncbi:MAG: hypothetical protein OJF55_002192 [Rhodanobacteraceae bacterium]|jgi:glycosyltransferase involved in cell wall biosynthesis|nr:MAG: hypothetical protein OJF55_002192 [Rhodanobacteraceae bacterium]
MKLALVISSLGGGGAERVMTVLANTWASGGNKVTLITLGSEREDKYPLDPAVRRVALGVTGNSSNVVHALGNNLLRIRALRRAIKACRPDVVISFMANTNLLAVLAASGLQVPVIVSERVSVAAQPPRGLRAVLYRMLYRRAAAVVAQTRRVAQDIEARTGHPAIVIANPVWQDPTTAARDGCITARNRRTLLAVGRLTPQKGFDLLIEAFARVAGQHANWDLTILGEGRQRAELMAKVAAHDLTDRVSMPGFSHHVRGVMRNADLFVLPSRFEGFPNALLEAMAEGRACVSCDCDAGPRELIRHGENGWLVPIEDVPTLAAALDTLMRDDGLRERLGARAHEVLTLYSLPAVVGRWNALLASVTTHAGGMKAAQEGAG